MRLPLAMAPRALGPVNFSEEDHVIRSEQVTENVYVVTFVRQAPEVRFSDKAREEAK